MQLAISGNSLSRAVGRDLNAGLVVFLVAVPLCLGIALSSNAPLVSGLLAGIMGGILVGCVSQSQTSVSGPAAALAAIVASQIGVLGSFQALQLAIVVAGLIQIVLGLSRAGAVAAFFPSSVIKGLLAAIGLLLILKQIPHLLGHDADPEGEMSFNQPNHANTFTELIHMLDHIHWGATAIGLCSLMLLIVWGATPRLKRLPIPAPLLVVVFGVALGAGFQWLGPPWAVETSNFVQVPIAEDFAGAVQFFQLPDFSRLSDPMIYKAAVTIALAASLATLLNLESVDKLDPEKRHSPPSWELVAQGFGNLFSGLLGGLPMTSEIVRGSVNVNAGNRTKLATIVHGCLLLASLVVFPQVLNLIPLSCLAAILLVTGAKLANAKLVKQMWDEGRYQFAPFAMTIVAIVLTDLLVGVVLGLVISLGFILNSNLRRPIRRIVEKHLGGEVLHIELANQVSFLNRAALSRVLDEVPPGGHVLLDAQDTDYIDPDILDLIKGYKEDVAPARNQEVSLIGFRSKYQLTDQVRYLDHSTRELQSQLTPDMVLQILKDGHARFRQGQRLTRDLGRQIRATAEKQHPLAVVLSCIDSRTPTELIFDLGLGDILSIRVAGNILSKEILGSMEYACAVAQAKLILIMGHSRCGAVTTAVECARSNLAPPIKSGCQNIGSIVDAIRQTMAPADIDRPSTPEEKENVVDLVARRNVMQVSETVWQRSQTLKELHEQGRVAIIGAMYDVITGAIEFLPHSDRCVT